MSDNDRPVLDAAFVRRALGKRILIGLTYERQSGEVIRHEQRHGIIERIDEHEGIVVRLPDGSRFKLPPDLRGIEGAPPGTYRLRSTGEEVEDPDFLCTWSISVPDA